MAIVNYVINTNINTGIGTLGTWKGYFEVNNLSTIVAADSPITIVASSAPEELFPPIPTVSFTPNSFRYYDDASGNNNQYITWSEYSGPSQYPDTGLSLDVWSTTLYNAIQDNYTWNALIGTSPYNLNLNKYSLVYKYDPPIYAPFWSFGGTITFS